jgi:hypothetical protein
MGSPWIASMCGSARGDGTSTTAMGFVRLADKLKALLAPALDSSEHEATFG